MSSNRKIDMDLFSAVRKGNKSLVESLLKLHADPNYVESKWTPIFHALYDNHDDIVRLLVKYGASVNVSDSTEDTPLYFASWGGSADMVKLLLDHGADPNVGSKEGTAGHGEESNLDVAIDHIDDDYVNYYDNVGEEQGEEYGDLDTSKYHDFNADRFHAIKLLILYGAKK